MSWPHDVLERFGAVACRNRPNTWLARCPAHDDVSPSLSLWTGRNGCLLVGCWAGCAKDRILAMKGLRMRDLFPPEHRDAYGKTAYDRLPPRKIVAVYGYTDEDGRVLYEAVRYQPKDFRQRQPDGKGGWKWSLDGVRLVPYLLPDLLARPHAPVWVVEGEGKAEALAALGLVATCNCGGCGMGWLDCYSAVLRGRRVVVLPDNDAAGVRHARLVVGSLMQSGAAGVRLALLPGLPEKGDVVDWLKKGGTKERLIANVQQFSEWRPT